MAEFKQVTTVGELPPGRCMTAVVDEQYVAVCNVNGAFHALVGVCPHAGGLLGGGTLEGCVVKCPEHGMRFDVTTGKSGSSFGVGTYPVKVEDGNILVALKTTPPA